MIFLVLSPWLPRWLGFQAEPGTGSLPLLFATGASGLAITFATGYANSLNMANGTITRPILPGLILGQLGLATHLLVVRMGGTLWAQNVVLLAYSVASVLLGLWMLRISHPWLRRTGCERYARRRA